MQRKCQKCNALFTVRKDEKICPECAGEKIYTCDYCGKPINWTGKRGRSPKSCEDCRNEIIKPSKHDPVVEAVADFKQDVVVSKKEIATDEKVDIVSHPAHYTMGTIEPKDFIRDQDLNFNRGNVIKYTVRAGRKNKNKEVEDLKKAKQYLEFEIEYLEGKK